ncbi:MAG: ribonuclease P protein component [Desulfovibrionales bacterium]
MGGLEFRKQNRLTERSQYLEVYSLGRRFYSKYFILFALSRGQGVFFWRLGITASKKIGSAVRRNRVKRLVREVVRRNQKILDRPVDIVVVAKRGIPTGSLTYGDVEADLVPVLRRIMRTLSTSDPRGDRHPPTEKENAPYSDVPH